ncbi:bifunctional hydroxymethylpyrimidine kinase/phosphomethylpyrimidine kinase [Neisseria sp. Ec49-e6-T10]|uniref:bifunctional hydroxymethylpyrimidine kinase/phosphomethylpyrimidine kinase n=1 Tax=Neisseria sp. Ec49-e6-T10 TaxID=3140744 RepID=UPI003EBDCEBD
MTQYHALTIAGSDSGGGAGIQADLKTFSALGAYGMSVITALTAQNTQGVNGVFPVSPLFVQAQADAVFSDIRVDAVKIGMLADVDVIEMVAHVLKQYTPSFVVLDPVMVAKGGASLLQETAVEALIESLLPYVNLITPNLPEAAKILGCEEAKNFEEMEKQALALHQMGVENVLIKGGHLASEEASDCLVEQNGQITWFSNPRVQTKHTHGTGCTLSAAICALYPQEQDLKSTIQKAKEYLYQAILAGKDMQIGQGIGPLHHFHAIW